MSNKMGARLGQGRSTTKLPDHLKTVSAKVKACHEEFLECDEGRNKPDALQILKGHINEYLNCVPHSYKFRFRETERVLSRSVSSVEDFEPQDASRAFEDLAVYAQNLLEQPWRKDFFKVKVTSGFFKHNISTHLEKSEDILKIMGYVETDDNDKILILPREPDPVILAAVSLDCYVASQECLVLSLVWMNVQREIPLCPLVMFEAYQVRKQRVGNVAFVVKCLVQESRERDLNSHVPVDRLIDIDPDESAYVHPPSPRNDCTLGINGVEESFAELLSEPEKIMDPHPPAIHLNCASTIQPSPSQTSPCIKGFHGIQNTSLVTATASPTPKYDYQSQSFNLVSDISKESGNNFLNGRTHARLGSPGVILPPTPMCHKVGSSLGITGETTQTLTQKSKSKNGRIITNNEVSEGESEFRMVRQCLNCEFWNQENIRCFACDEIIFLES